LFVEWKSFGFDTCVDVPCKDWPRERALGYLVTFWGSGEPLSREVELWILFEGEEVLMRWEGREKESFGAHAGIYI
jgi:hypothetical protein